MRWFSKTLSAPLEIDHITLESPDSGVAPTLVAITAELADANAPLPPANEPALDAIIARSSAIKVAVAAVD